MVERQESLILQAPKKGDIMNKLGNAHLIYIICFCLMGFPFWTSKPARAAEQVSAGGGTFSADRLNQLVAPIALYPDSLLSQILMASTYPLEVVQAARWLKQNKGLQGDAIQSALADKNWDASVKSLVLFPDVLNRMNDNLDWTQDLGDAFLAQQQDVMNAIQRMRAKAKDAGNLKTSKEEKVIVEKDVIQIEPADPQVIYVPAYNPTVVYGPTWYAPSWYYPAVMVPPFGYAAAASALSFGIGVAVGAAMFGGFDWGHNNVVINNNYYNNRLYRNQTNINNRNIDNRNVWQHDPGHRGNVPYRDQTTAARFAQAGSRPPGDNQRAFRGFDQPDKFQPKSDAGVTGKGFSGDARGGIGEGFGKDSGKMTGLGKGSVEGLGGRGEAFHGMENGGFEHTFSDRGFESRGGGFEGAGGFGRGGGFGGGRGGRR